jgi:hypothetical protein
MCLSDELSLIDLFFEEIIMDYFDGFLTLVDDDLSG